MITNYKELSNKWRKFEVHGETHYAKFEGEDITNLQARKNGKLERVEIPSTESNCDLREAIDSILTLDLLIK